MPHPFACLFALFCAVLLGVNPANAASAGANYEFATGKVELISETPTWTVGLPLRVGLKFDLNPHWHIYWRNSGDSGSAPKWKWTIENGTLGAEQWPLPKRIPVAGLINLAYEKSTLINFAISPNQPNQPLIAAVKLEFLVCKIECVPYFTDLALEVPYAAQKATPRALFSEQVFPTPAPADFNWQILGREGDFLRTELSLPKALRDGLKYFEVFPYEGEFFKPLAPEMERKGDKLMVKLALQDTKQPSFTGSKFLLVLEPEGAKRQSFDIVLAAAKNASFALVFLWALLGGLILNVMPCVFPVLSIKILSFLGPKRDAAKLKRSGLYYTAGVVVSFMALGGALLAFRAAGEQIGWGFQLQSPTIAAAIGLLFFWMGLNFLGAFEIGNSLVGVGGTSNDSSPWGSFLTGVLATIVATPCTAPFMGAALGAALTMPTLHTMGIFFGLGVGMALPFLLLAYYPRFLKTLPRPGAWMLTMKEFLAFPLFATVLWLLWVLSQQIAVDGILFVLALLFLVSLWVWLSVRIRNLPTRQVFLLIGFVTSFACLTSLPRDKAMAAPGAASLWNKYSEAGLAAEREAGHAVFIDFTAAWCITCQVNKKLVLNTEPIQNLFRKNGVTLFKADWTDQDPVVTQALASFGRNSLPLYVYYAPNSQKAEILPEVLTTAIVEDLFNKQENRK